MGDIIKKVLILCLFGLFLSCSSGKETIHATYVDQTQSARFETKFESAISLFKSNQFQKAKKAFNDLLKANPTDWIPYYYLGLIKLENKRFVESEALFFEALNYVSQNKIERAQIYKSLGDLYDAQQKTAPAKLNYLTAYKLDPKSVEIQIAAQKYQLISSTK